MNEGFLDLKGATTHFGLLTMLMIAETLELQWQSVR